MSWIFALIVPTDRIAFFVVGLVFILSTLGLPTPLRASENNINAKPLTVFAAASLADVLPALANQWRQDGSKRDIIVSLGASAIMARQINAGAQADLFISANRHWVDFLRQGTATNDKAFAVATNSLVLALPCATIPGNGLSPERLRELVTASRFAMADPSLSPAGDYARKWLQAENLWSAARQNAAYANNVRLTLLLVERAHVPGFVYRSDLKKSRLACEALKLTSRNGEAIQYFALVPTTAQPDTIDDARTFINWLRSSAATMVWQEHGFGPIVPK